MKIRTFTSSQNYNESNLDGPKREMFSQKEKKKYEGNDISSLDVDGGDLVHLAELHSEMIQIVTPTNLEGVLSSTSSPIIIFAHSPKQQSSVILASKLAQYIATINTLTVGSKSRTLLLALADVDKHPALRHRLQVSTTPTIYVTQSGSVVEILSPVRHMHGENFDNCAQEESEGKEGYQQLSYIPFRNLHEMFVRIKTSFGIDAPLKEEDFLDKPGQIDKIFKDALNSAAEDLMNIFSLESSEAKESAEAALPKYMGIIVDSASSFEQKAEAYGGAFRCFIYMGKYTDAVSVWEKLENLLFNRIEKIEEMPGIKQALSLGRISRLGGVTRDRLALANSPDPEELQLLKEKVYGTDMADMTAAYEYTRKILAEGHYEEGVKLCLDMIRKDMDWNESAAKKLLLDVFEALGPQHEITQRGRKRLKNLCL
eukprot:Nk52_evm88s230 gene=Nk52_evmTU88s230